jgi:CheY-like chemotaxis protein
MLTYHAGRPDNLDGTASVLQLTFERMGHEVLVTRSGTEAWETFDRQPVRVVVSDWMMLGIDGLEFCRRIRATDPHLLLLPQNKHRRRVLAAVRNLHRTADRIAIQSQSLPIGYASGNGESGCRVCPVKHSPKLARKLPVSVVPAGPIKGLPPPGRYNDGSLIYIEQRDQRAGSQLGRSKSMFDNLIVPPCARRR